MFPWMKGFGSEGAIINIIFNLFLSAFIAWHYYFKPRKMKKQGNDRRKPDNPGVKPGFGEACKEHAESLVEIGTKVENIEKNIDKMEKNNRQDHKDIFDKIDLVRNNRR